MRLTLAGDLFSSSNVAHVLLEGCLVTQPLFQIGCALLAECDGAGVLVHVKNSTTVQGCNLRFMATFAKSGRLLREG